MEKRSKWIAQCWSDEWWTVTFICSVEAQVEEESKILHIQRSLETVTPHILFRCSKQKMKKEFFLKGLFTSNFSSNLRF